MPDLAPTLPLLETDDEPSAAQRAAMMLRVFGNERLAFYESERAAFYLNILYEMLLFRRDHELQPLHEDLYYAVRERQTLFGADYEPNQFAADVAQLLAWGNLAKILEPYRLRSYRDYGRENFRYVLNENTVEFLQWLEYRVRARAEGRSRDGRNFLQDIVAALQELARLCNASLPQEISTSEETARRALHLMYASEDHIHDLSSELLEFRAYMVQFISRAYAVETLKAILHWLGRYVEVYLQGIYDLRERILELIAQLDRGEIRAFLDHCHDMMEAQRRQMPPALRGDVAAEPLRAERFLRHTLEFFARHQRLDELCERLNGTAREVIKKMDAKLREIERRNTRIHDLKARIRELAAAPANGEFLQTPAAIRQHESFSTNGRVDECAAGYHFINALLSPSHAIFDGQYWDLHTKASPPRPRYSRRSVSSAVPLRFLKPKTKTPQEVFALEAQKRDELRQWIARVLDGEPQILLRARQLDDPEAAHFWMRLMHYAYVTPAKDLPALKIKITQLIDNPASVLIGSVAEGLYTPDHWLKGEG